MKRREHTIDRSLKGLFEPFNFVTTPFSIRLVYSAFDRTYHSSWWNSCRPSGVGDVNFDVRRLRKMNARRELRET